LDLDLGVSLHWKITVNEKKKGKAKYAKTNLTLWLF
jgi:hypothetical protein